MREIQNTPNFAPIQKMNYTRSDACQALNVSMVTLDAFLHRANDPLPSFRAGSRKILIPVKSLEAWVERETQRNTGRA